MIANSFTIATDADSAMVRPSRRLEGRLTPVLAFRPRLRRTSRRNRANRCSVPDPGMRCRTRLDSRMLHHDRTSRQPLLLLHVFWTVTLPQPFERVRKRLLFHRAIDVRGVAGEQKLKV